MTCLSILVTSNLKQIRWYDKRYHALKRLRLIKEYSQENIISEYSLFLKRRDTLLNICNKLGLSPSTVTSDLAYLKINRSRFREHVRPAGCCSKEYHSTVIAECDERGSFEWRELKETT